MSEHPCFTCGLAVPDPLCEGNTTRSKGGLLLCAGDGHTILRPQAESCDDWRDKEAKP